MRKYLEDGFISFSFSQTKENFFVEEIPLKPFLKKGKFIVLKIKKEELSTWEVLAILSKYLSCRENEIGYAGLKDKYATTIQYLSFSKKYEKALASFRHPKIKILEKFYAKEPIKMGDLKKNKFEIILDHVNNIHAGKIEKKAKKIIANGLANYFGYQRFGNDKKSIDFAKDVVFGNSYVKDSKKRKFFVNMYQSYLFNQWLSYRIALSENGCFKLLEGDVYIDTNNKLITPKTIPYKAFLEKKLIPTGLLPGREVFRAKSKALIIEKKFDEPFIMQKGMRREAIVFIENFSMQFFPNKEQVLLSFSLPKGSYATVFLEALQSKELKS